MKKKIAIAMSGGVDSGVAAALVVKAGYQAAGFHMHLWSEGGEKQVENKCCSTESLEAARKTAHKLGLPFYIVDLEESFKKRVVDYFLREYSQGRTPNPCVVCNRLIKFGELLDYARKIGYEFLATGHYARLAKDNRYHLWQAEDKKKDQSYFLYNLTQKKLSQVIFPVGDYPKDKVKQMARKLKLPVATRPESQEICFFPETDYRPFLKRQIPGQLKPGKVVDTQGQIIGRHQGLPLYTIGQRHGFELGAGTAKKPGVIPPYYVIGKDHQKNRLIVGFGKEAERKDFLVGDLNWIQPMVTRCKVRIRHQGELLTAKIQGQKDKKRVKVILDESQRGVAPGQAAVFYKKFKNSFEVLGGGIIS